MDPTYPGAREGQDVPASYKTPAIKLIQTSSVGHQSLYRIKQIIKKAHQPFYKQLGVHACMVKCSSNINKINIYSTFHIKSLKSKRPYVPMKIHPSLFGPGTQMWRCQTSQWQSNSPTFYNWISMSNTGKNKQ